jgi:6-phosphogluconolactonase
MAVSEFIELFADPPALARAAAQRLARLAQEAVTRRGMFAVALSGGSTPAGLYTLLANDSSLRNAMPWSGMHFFFGDERPVPPEHPDSNYRLANETLFRHLAPDSVHVHRIPAECPDAAEAASRYTADMQQFFQKRASLVAGWPQFDLVLLGMGPDGHTASLFPGSPALQENQRWVMANWVEKLRTHRITMTLPVLNAAAEVLLLVAGADKAAMVAQVLDPAIPGPPYPVQMVQPYHGLKRWMLDQAAASQLAQRP